MPTHSPRWMRTTPRCGRVTGRLFLVLFLLAMLVVIGCSLNGPDRGGEHPRRGAV